MTRPLCQIEDGRSETLCTLAIDRLDGRAHGLGMPVLWHLALRRYGPAMGELATRFDDGGPIANPFSSRGLAYRAFKLGETWAAQNLAMQHFNRNDLQGYRYWLHRAARAGDEEARMMLKRFETRLPHGAAGDIGRKRPYDRREKLSFI